MRFISYDTFLFHCKYIYIYCVVLCDRYISILSLHAVTSIVKNNLLYQGAPHVKVGPMAWLSINTKPRWTKLDRKNKKIKVLHAHTSTHTFIHLFFFSFFFYLFFHLFIYLFFFFHFVYRIIYSYIQLFTTLHQHGFFSQHRIRLVGFDFKPEYEIVISVAFVIIGRVNCMICKCSVNEHNPPTIPWNQCDCKHSITERNPRLLVTWLKWMIVSGVETVLVRTLPSTDAWSDGYKFIFPFKFSPHEYSSAVWRRSGIDVYGSGWGFWRRATSESTFCINSFNFAHSPALSAIPFFCGSKFPVTLFLACFLICTRGSPSK